MDPHLLEEQTGRRGRSDGSGWLVGCVVCLVCLACLLLLVCLDFLAFSCCCFCCGGCLLFFRVYACCL